MSTTLSCGHCGAALRPEQDWCSICYTANAPAFDPLTAPIGEVIDRAGEPEAVVRVQEVAPAEVAPPQLVEQTPDSITDLDVMFSMLAAEHRRADVTAGIAERLEDKSTRMMVMIGGTALIATIGFLALTILGAIF